VYYRSESAGSRRALNDLHRDVQPHQPLHEHAQSLHAGDHDRHVRVFVAFTFTLELAAVVALALLEYFLRCVFFGRVA